MHIAVALLYGCGVSQNCLSSQLPCSVLFFNGGWVFPRSSCGFWNIVEAVALLQIVAKGLYRLFSFTASVTLKNLCFAWLKRLFLKKIISCKNKSCSASHFFFGNGYFFHAQTLLNERVRKPFQIECFFTFFGISLLFKRVSLPFYLKGYAYPFI